MGKNYTDDELLEEVFGTPHYLCSVAANVQRLIGWNRSMAVALERAENGSPVEDAYFIEKLEKSVNAIGFVLDSKPVDDEIPSRRHEAEEAKEFDDALSIQDITPKTLSALEYDVSLAEFLAEYIDRHEYKSQAGETGALEEVIIEGIQAYEAEVSVTVTVERR